MLRHQPAQQCCGVNPNTAPQNSIFWLIMSLDQSHHITGRTRSSCSGGSVPDLAADICPRPTWWWTAKRHFSHSLISSSWVHDLDHPPISPLTADISQSGDCGSRHYAANSTNTATGLFKAACRRVVLRIPHNDAAWRVIHSAVWALSEQ